METSEIIKTLMKQRGYTYRTLADKMGYTSTGSVYDRLKGKMSVEIFLKFLDALDCELRVYSNGDDGLEFEVNGR